MKNLPHLAGRIFGTPLLMQRAKLDAILTALAPRLVIEGEQSEIAVREAVAAVVATDGSKQRKPYQVTPDGTAVISILGPLIQRGSWMDAMCGLTSYSQIEGEFMDAVGDPAITGIVLDCDSPGGEVSGCFDLADKIFASRGSKPIVAAVNDMCFSACFALASAADKIVMTRTGGIGSVGVIMRLVDQTGADQQKGLKYTNIFAGDRKVDMDSHSPLSPEATAIAQSEVDRIYDLFVETVARNRGMKQSAVRNTQAGLFFGDTGVAVGFADSVGTPRDALSLTSDMLTSKSSYSIPAASAVGSPKKEANILPEPTKPADASSAPDINALIATARAEAETEGYNKGKAEGKVKGYADALEVVQLCVLAGTPLMATEYLEASLKPKDVRDKLASERIKADVPIVSHTGLQTGTGQDSANVEDSPLVKAATKAAAEYRGNKGGL